jgi:hypothetical protein
MLGRGIHDTAIEVRRPQLTQAENDVKSGVTPAEMETNTA